MPLRDFGNYKPPQTTVNFVLLSGGVGDHVASLVALDYVIKNYKWITPLIWLPSFLVDFAKNVLPSNVSIRDFSQMKDKYDRNRPTKTTEWDGHTSPMKIRGVDYGFLKLCDENPSIEHKNYLKVNTNAIDVSPLGLPPKYVVLATGFTVGVREFNADAVNAVASYALSKGYTPVFLGQTETKTGVNHVIKGNFNKEIDYSVGVNLINKTSLLQAAKVMQGSAAVVGVDCGLLHIAGCTDAPIIGGFTTVSPELRAPIRHDELGWNFYPVVPEDTLKCRFCQVKTNFLYNHDYTKCIYKDLLCVKQLTGDKFIAQLEKVLK